MRMPLIVLAVLFLVPCWASASGEDSEPSSTSWVGKSADELVASLGRPTKTKRGKKGAKIFVYRFSSPREKPEVASKSAMGWRGTDSNWGGRASDPPPLYNGGGLPTKTILKLRFYVDQGRTIYKEETLAPKEKKKKDN